MKHSPSTQHLQKFTYIDSSEQQSDHRPNQPHQLKVQRQCNKQPTFKSDYEKQLQEIVQSQIEKIQHGERLIVPIGEKEMEEALRKRHEKYKWFLKQMEIDKRYAAIVGGRVAQLQKQNKKKDEVLLKKRLQQQFRAQQDKLKKYVIEKGDKQQKVINHLHQATHKLGIERNALIAKRIKSQVTAHRQQTEVQVTNLQNKQRNELQQLKNQYKEMKEQERLNKLEQAKVLRDLELKNKELKRDMQQKLTLKREFVI